MLTTQLKKAGKRAQVLGKGEFGNTVLPITSAGRGYYSDLKGQGVTPLGTPMQFVGAVGAKLLTDLGTDGTRNQYWRYNHPSPVTQTVYEKVAGAGLSGYSTATKSCYCIRCYWIYPLVHPLVHLILQTLENLARPKGFAQSYAEQLVQKIVVKLDKLHQSLIDRFALGRQGRPLKFETAKEDIPDLTKERYTNYQKFLYNEKGPLGIGVIKGTMENLAR